jgi:hypothetical protein
MSGGFTFPSDERLVPRYSEITDGPQQRIYQRTLWDAIPLPLFGPLAGAGLYNNGGVLGVDPDEDYPPAGSLPPGSIYSNNGVVSVVPGIIPDPGAMKIFFGDIDADTLLALGGGNLPFSGVTAGSLQLWNPGGLGEVWVA